MQQQQGQAVCDILLVCYILTATLICEQTKQQQAGSVPVFVRSQKKKKIGMRSDYTTAGGVFVFFHHLSDFPPSIRSSCCVGGAVCGGSGWWLSRVGIPEQRQGDLGV